MKDYSMICFVWSSIVDMSCVTVFCTSLPTPQTHRYKNDMYLCWRPPLGYDSNPCCLVVRPLWSHGAPRGLDETSGQAWWSPAILWICWEEVRESDIGCRLQLLQGALWMVRYACSTSDGISQVVTVRMVWMVYSEIRVFRKNTKCWILCRIILSNIPYL